MNVSPGETRIARLENGVLSELIIERDGEAQVAGNIYLGRVTRVLPGMQAAFVDIGLEKAAFLYVGDIVPDLFEGIDEDDEESEPNGRETEDGEDDTDSAPESDGLDNPDNVQEEAEAAERREEQEQLERERKAGQDKADQIWMLGGYGETLDW